MDEMKKTILGIDFNNIVYMSYYGEKLINSKGENLNAVKGFFFKLKMLIDAVNPDYIVFASDISRSKTFRRKLYKNYKSNRKPTDDDIRIQLGYVHQLLTQLGYPILNNELYEADDILGMVSKYATDNNMNMVIVSSDKDLYQLINEDVVIFSPRNREIIDIDLLKTNYQLTPSEWIELKILQGDRSDNIPGIHGIGNVIALKLIKEYKSVENVYEHIRSIKPNVRELLLSGRKYIDLTRKLVTIITDYEKIDLNAESLVRSEVDQDAVMQILHDTELKSLINVMKYSLFR